VGRGQRIGIFAVRVWAEHLDWDDDAKYGSGHYVVGWWEAGREGP